MSFLTLGILYPHSGRELRRFITAILKQNAAERIDRINYVHSFHRNEEGKITKTEQKLLHITLQESQKDRCLSVIKKLLNQKQLTYFEVQYDQQ